LKAGIAFTFNGIGAIIGGYFGGVIYDKFSLKISTYLNIMLLFMILVCTYAATFIVNYYICCGLFFLWGIALYYFEVWILISCSRLFYGRL
jgi:predicted MFS family arabinose efflux permease